LKHSPEHQRTGQVDSTVTQYGAVTLRTFADLRVFFNLLPQKLVSGKVAVAKVKFDLQVNGRSMYYEG